MDGITRLSSCSTLLRRCSGSYICQQLRFRSRTHYEVLGVSKTCSTKDIREAYMTLSKKLHPDVSPGSHSEFVLLNEAYQTLSRRQARALYDASLLRPTTAAPPPGQSWKRYGDVESTHDRVFTDDTIWGMRDRSKDSEFSDKPYYGIRGVKRLSNGPIAVFCLLFMVLGIFIHVTAIRASHQSAMAYIDEKNRRIYATYSDAKSKAMDPKDKTKVESFLKSLKADAVE
ncbi:dnaJ homolog subfamily C member 4-like [Amphibalanus amphitrite]|uniref:dnaJ homolog subfamily C member 4-like n=1 Tax=Amphibalanus amphitrite TaxID=1232801 RepID=UPI001C91F816|nr:dnaJ homolog subfamily C member 4-like [Amphibalanus amphitrite]XP_043230378.1 dnaJ homolog subfamily C member 4-like [Amphibalanus amphitrite]XP_043230379.1 dnaJ homolog subfamily C member 4-like [Amphibalanus amphitrite]XP_043230380.1 dnaJ homolog subfamily C member 4-like [Amphibalanus amphitrite]XP_043230381.1 dnaJ homolog subfamily C member 4-like [Amphibalanus amphitrite]